MQRRFLAGPMTGGIAALLPAMPRAQGGLEDKPEGERFRVELPALSKVAIARVPVGNGNAVPMTEATSWSRGSPTSPPMSTRPPLRPW